ncbi:TIGR00300 family protein [Methanoculleus sp. YWC-01]|jgi:lysine-ketoglutarate reductase/saccharopine dehydrogenase-like protein (TIGR00300 family)|uniref:Ornithine cyclodeaminase n=1 Tax=Methanoculleus nereidis TaxID=2735141 RepID=A0ABU3Z4B4_9EURY|nr:TIGR00300 family protein [Methanoculleus sp. YWC-01]MCK9297953.1 TIGR00300 family protein [Methanoculleus sp.]MDV4343647.1 TIGR00300 family protein [Methanoculleus sp. YWC-01]PKL55082.1 MAG: TIGR00300 family protein [Methanomicrobiales archaeon HGW-Methanomicrobiales-6]
MDSCREIELEGHIIDSGVMTLVFDRVMDMGGEFEILTFNVGRLKTDTSYARLRVTAPSDHQLDAILSELHRLGARAPEIDDVTLVPAEGDRILPKGFYSTTNHPTFVKYRDEWLPVERIEMDCHIVVEEKEKRAICTPISKIKAGDAVVVSEAGVRVVYPERPRKVSTFEFMHGTVSSERPSEAIIAKIAREILKSKQKGEKIALVGGPAIVHTGAADALARMIRAGCIDVLFAGNALATHDIESNLYGTSLGMDVKTGTLVTGGHKHHIRAISEIMRAGSIKNAVDQGIVTGGIMYECVKKGIPFVLAGSIRDDGPLPDTITDVVEAQEVMRRHIHDLGMVVMVGTLLHSIAVGNCLPSYVKTVCVDINPASVTKLMDRGTTQAIGVVSDAGTFLPLLCEQLEEQREC